MGTVASAGAILKVTVRMRSDLFLPSRRALLTGAAGMALAGCGKKEQSDADAQAPKGGKVAEIGKIATIAEAVAGPWRPAADKARDAWRHPVESLTFWGLKPG